MQILEWLRWRVTQARVRKAAAEMLEEAGEHAFFASHEEAWKAQGAGEARKAEFKKAVCLEIARTIQRREILRAIMAPARRSELQRDRPDARGRTRSSTRNLDFVNGARRRK
jgi:hypothetical protein